MAMPLTRRPYRSETDLRLLLAWLGRHRQHAFMHPGDLTWWLRQNEAVDPIRALDLFFLETEGLGGFVFSDPVTWAVLQGREDLPPAAWAQMIHAAETKAGQPVTFNTYTAEGWHSPRVDALERAGYRPSSNRLARLQQVLTPAHLDPVLLPAGYRFTDMAQADVSTEDRVALHRAVWHPSRVTLDAYRHLQAAPNYDPALDVVIVGSAGEPAAYALGWFDPLSRTGLLEPVGTHVAFRRQGLGQQLVREVTRRLSRLGALSVSLGTREGNAAALGLYQAAGYQVTGYWVDFQRPDDE